MIIWFFALTFSEPFLFPLGFYSSLMELSRYQNRLKSLGSSGNDDDWVIKPVI